MTWLSVPDRLVITTRHVTEFGHAITLVSCDEDGDLRALSDYSSTEDDVVVVSIAHILRLDPTLNTLPDLQKNETFVRANTRADWMKLE